MAVAFVLGSGTSVDAGMPRVNDISEQVFGGAGVVQHSDATYYIASESSGNYDWYRAKALPAIGFCGDLRQLADAYFQEWLDGRAANYEDVANLAKQIVDAITGEYENPALFPFLAELLAESSDRAALLERARDARDYIRDIVWRMLNRPIGDVSYLSALVDGCRALGTSDVFELNHDRVVEKALAQAGLDVADGFTRGAGDVTFWTDTFDRPLRHFHLHGSVTWFHRNLADEPWRGLVVARSGTNHPYHDRDEDGELLEFPADGRPVLLTGTFDKPLAYDSTIYADQHYRFHEALRNAQAVVVIGYGFRDKGINARLISWWHRAPDRRMVVVHGDVENLVEGARGAIANKWNSLIHDGRLRVIEKWVADVSWADIAEALAS